MFKKGETFEMAIASKTRSSFDGEIEEMGRSPSAGRNWIAELSPVANVMVRRCSKTLGISISQLQESFDGEASDAIKHSSRYAQNFLEYCFFKVLALSTEVTGYLDGKKFRRLTFNMMIAWEFPSASSQPLLNGNKKIKVSVRVISPFCLKICKSRNDSGSRWNSHHSASSSTRGNFYMAWSLNSNKIMLSTLKLFALCLMTRQTYMTCLMI